MGAPVPPANKAAHPQCVEPSVRSAPNTSQHITFPKDGGCGIVRTARQDWHVRIAFQDQHAAIRVSHELAAVDELFLARFEPGRGDHSVAATVVSNTPVRILPLDFI